MLPAYDTALQYRTLDTRRQFLLVSLNATAVPSAIQHNNVNNMIGRQSEAAQAHTKCLVAHCKLDWQQHNAVLLVYSNLLATFTGAQRFNSATRVSQLR